MKSIGKLRAAGLAVTLAGAVVVGAVGLAPSPAYAACSSNLSTWKVKNASCSQKIQHVNQIGANGRFEYRVAPWAKKTQWSQQPACWQNTLGWFVEPRNAR